MINRYFKDRVRNDVSGLEDIKVLIDRSETDKTETGWNCLMPALEGSFHMSEEKDQVFYITEGKGEIRVGDMIIPVEEGNLVYVPAGKLNQTQALGDTPLCYILFNVFNDPRKDEQLPQGKVVEAIFLSNPDQGKVYEFGSNTTTLLLERNNTNKVELALIRWPEGSRGAMAAHKDKEQTFYVLSGRGNVTIDGQTEQILPGHVVFIPRNIPHTSEALEGELVYLCLNALVNPADGSFDSMYQRVIPGRMDRWKKGNDEAGE